MERITQTINRILATPDSANQQPTTARLDGSKQQETRQKWLNRWLRLKLTHPQLEALAETVYDYAADVFHKPRNGRLLVIYGHSGSGKTHALKAITAWFNRVRMAMAPIADNSGQMTQPGTMLVNWPDVVDGFKQGRWDIVEDLSREYLVGIDDIGAEHDPSKIGAEKIYVILNNRQRRYTIITTNNPPAEWEQRFERRIASRLFRNALHVDLTEVPDYSPNT